jgi:nucleotide-binding universal stress UspA family protein
MTRTVAVGVGGTGGRPALGWAGDEAQQTGARLVLLHACPPASPLARQPGRPSATKVEQVDPPLARAVSTAQTRLGRGRVSFRILEGDPGAALPTAAAHAGLLVIGSGSGGSTVRRVIRHANCPVLVARPVSHELGAAFPGHVVVGVTAGSAGHEAIGFAFGYAEQRRLPLCAVRVQDGDLVAAIDLLQSQIEPWKLRYPQVQVLGIVVHGGIADGLTWAGAGARLLVVGNRHRGPLGRARTGDVPLTVARRAACPVAVVPARS